METRFSRHRGVVAGKQVDDNEIKQILRDSEDPDERREAWEASKTVGDEVAEDVRELARMRNEAARSLGYRDWFALSLTTDEMSEEKLLETLAAADRATAEPFARWKGSLDTRLAGRFRCDVSELRPWHYADPFFQEPPAEGAVDLDPLFKGKDVVALAGRTFEGIGFAVKGILDRSDLFPRPGKNQHAFCIDVDRGGDVRVLANVVDNHGWTDTMLHELGHGVYDLGFDEELSWVLARYAPRHDRGVRASLRSARGRPRMARAHSRGRCARGGRARGSAAFRPSRRAFGLHALGAGHERVRARALCRP